MPELRVRMTAEELATIDARAREHDQGRRDYVRALLLDDDRPLDALELSGLLARKAREGNMRAIELLSRATGALPATTAGPGPSDPFEEVDELAERRRATG